MASSILFVSCDREAPKSQLETPKPQSIVIDNVSPRRDVAGNIIDAHGGCLQNFNGRFYLYGTAYGTRKDSLDTNNYFCVYSSPDLQKWTLEGRLIPDQPCGVYTRPYVVFNASTRKYVLWYNWFPKLWDGQAGVAVSDTPTGPFTVVTPKAHLAGSHPGDGSLFEDDDGQAYYIYTDMGEGYAIRSERLTPDYTDSSGQVSKPFVTGGEAPLLLRRKNYYYALISSLCPDCSEGGEVQVYLAVSPLGPFGTALDANINHRSGTNIMALSAEKSSITNQAPAGGNVQSLAIDPQHIRPIVPAQQTWIAKIPTGGEPLLIWMGDLWGSTPDGAKGHDFQYWSPPLSFDSNFKIMPIEGATKWSMTLQ